MKNESKFQILGNILNLYTDFQKILKLILKRDQNKSCPFFYTLIHKKYKSHVKMKECVNRTDTSTFS